MLNVNKIFAYLVGLIFLIAGLGVALDMLNIPFSSVLLLLTGIFTLCMYIKLKNSVLKYITCMFIPTGLAYFIIAAFRLSGVPNFLLVYFSLVCSFFCIYLFSKKKVFLYISLLIIMFVFHTITLSTETMNEFIFGYDCFGLGILSTILFVFEHKSLKYTPILIAFIAYLSGVLNILYVLKFITPVLFKMLISLIFLIIGVSIIFYNYIKSKK